MRKPRVRILLIVWIALMVVMPHSCRPDQRQIRRGTRRWAMGLLGSSKRSLSSPKAPVVRSNTR